MRRLLRDSGTDPADMHPSIRWTQSDRALPTLELTALIVSWKKYQSRMLDFMKDCDSIMSPASVTPASKFGVLLEPYGDQNKTRISIRSKKGKDNIEREDALPVLWALAGELRRVEAGAE